MVMLEYTTFTCHGKTQDCKMSFLLVSFSQLAHEFNAIPIKKIPVGFFNATWQDDFKIYLKVNVMNSKGNFVKEQRRDIWIKIKAYYKAVAGEILSY